MELRQLEYFLAVVEHEGMNRAAQQLFVAQPTLSHGIAALERELGVRLFDRTRRHLVLTAAGALLVPKARAILDGVLAARDTMDRARDLTAGTVTVGTMPEMSSDAVASWIPSFPTRHPEVRLDIAEYSGARALGEAVLSGECEVGFTTFPTPAEELVAVRLGVQRLLLVTPPDSGTVEAPMSLRELDGLPLAVCPLAQRENDLVLTALRGVGVEPRLVASVPNRHAQLTLVLGGGVNAFLPLRLAVRGRAQGAVVVETDPVVSAPFGVVHRPPEPAPAAAALIAECRDTLGRWYARIEERRAAGDPLIESAAVAYAELQPG